MMGTVTGQFTPVCIRKSQDGAGVFTHLPHLPPMREGVIHNNSRLNLWERFGVLTNTHTSTLRGGKRGKCSALLRFCAVNGCETGGKSAVNFTPEVAA